jgi:voltage-gated potassium channel
MLAPLEVWARVLVYIIDAAICAFFAWQFYLDLKVAPEKRAYWKSHWFEVLALVPLALLAGIQLMLPVSHNMVVILVYQLMLVPFIVLRVMRVFSLTDRFVRQRGLIYLVLISFGFIFVGALIMLILEQGSGRTQITDFQDALWWSTAAITKVGFNDVSPVTPAGRVLGMIWMIIGMVVMADLISELSARLVESRIKRRDGDELRDKMVEEIKARVERIDQLDEDEMKMLVNIMHALRQKSGSASNLKTGEPG